MTDSLEPEEGRVSQAQCDAVIRAVRDKLSLPEGDALILTARALREYRSQMFNHKESFERTKGRDLGPAKLHNELLKIQHAVETLHAFLDPGPRSPHLAPHWWQICVTANKWAKENGGHPSHPPKIIARKDLTDPPVVKADKNVSPPEPLMYYRTPERMADFVKIADDVRWFAEILNNACQNLADKVGETNGGLYGFLDGMQGPLEGMYWSLDMYATDYASTLFRDLTGETLKRVNVASNAPLSNSENSLSGAKGRFLMAFAEGVAWEKPSAGALAQAYNRNWVLVDNAQIRLKNALLLKIDL